MEQCLVKASIFGRGDGRWRRRLGLARNLLFELVFTFKNLFFLTIANIYLLFRLCCWRVFCCSGMEIHSAIPRRSGGYDWLALSCWPLLSWDYSFGSQLASLKLAGGNDSVSVVLSVLMARWCWSGDGGERMTWAIQVRSRFGGRPLVYCYSGLSWWPEGFNIEFFSSSFFWNRFVMQSQSCDGGAWITCLK